MILPVCLTTAGAAALINAWLSIRCGQVRIADKVMIGDGGNSRLAARMRAHANFVEYTPIVLVLVALIEFARGTSPWLWAVCALYLLARLAHPFGMDGLVPARMFGALVTLLVTIGLGLYAVTIPFTGGTQVTPIPDPLVEAVPAG